MHITYRVEQLEGSKGYIAYCPAMRPVRVFGKTREEATRKIPEAIRLYIEKHPELKTQLESIDTVDVS
jgi:predicted RNase H-like HicB family nuclease